MATLVGNQIIMVTTLAGNPFPVLQEQPLRASDAVYRALEQTGLRQEPDAQRGARRRDRDHRRVARRRPSPVYTLAVPLAEDAGKPGQTREDICRRPSVFQVPDVVLHREPGRGAHPARDRDAVAAVHLPGPDRDHASSASWSARRSPRSVPSIIAAVLLAQWLTSPVRRLTHASRALAEGRLDVRVPVNAVRVARAGRAGRLLQRHGRAAPGVDRHHQRRPRPQPRVPGRRLARAAHAHRRAAHLQRAAARGRRRGPRDARRVPGADAGARSSGSTGWPPTCSSCPSSTRAWCRSTCDRTTCARSSRAPSSRPSRSPSARASTWCMHLPDRAGPPAARPAAHRPGAHQPHRQRHQVHARGRPRGRGAARRPPTAPSWSSPTPAWASRPTSCPTSSSASGAGHGRRSCAPAARAWACPSSSRSWTCTTGRINILSAPDTGTRVTVDLPRSIAVSSPAGGPGLNRRRCILQHRSASRPARAPARRRRPITCHDRRAPQREAIDRGSTRTTRRPRTRRPATDRPRWVDQGWGCRAGGPPASAGDAAALVRPQRRAAVRARPAAQPSAAAPRPPRSGDSRPSRSAPRRGRGGIWRSCPRGLASGGTFGLLAAGGYLDRGARRAGQPGHRDRQVPARPAERDRGAVGP